MTKKYKLIIIIYIVILCSIFMFNKGLLKNINMDLSYVSCGSATGIPSPIPKVTTIGYTLLMVGTPLALIIFAIITLVKANVSSSADEISKARGKLIKKIIIAILIFVTAALVQFVITKVASNSNDKNSISKCLKCFLNFNSTDCPESSTGNDVKKGTYRKSNESNSVGTESNSNKKNNKNKSSLENSIIVGDSRVDSICNVPLSKWDTTLSVECRDMWGVVHGGKGHVWFKDEAVPLINKKLAENTSKKYNIVFFMGLGNLGLREDKQADYTASIYMKAMLNEIENGTWDKHHVIVVSLTDIGQEVVTAGGASFDRVAIAEFNKVMKQKVDDANLDNMEYCDISKLDVKNDTKDNIHYTSAGDDKIYNEIVSKCIK